MTVKKMLTAVALSILLSSASLAGEPAHMGAGPDVGNKARTSQYGDLNAAATSQNGRENAAHTIQRGDGNAAQIGQTGDGNRGRIIQIGNGLSAVLEQVDGDRGNVIQVSRGRAAVDIRTGRDGRSILIDGHPVGTGRPRR